MYKFIYVKIARSGFSFFIIFFSYFHFNFDLILYFLFMELRVRVDGHKSWDIGKGVEGSRRSILQTSFSLYLHNQWTNFHKLSCTRKLQMRAICTKATINNWDIRPSVAMKALSANILWIAKYIHMIKLALESAHQSVYNDIWCVSKQ